MSFGLTPKVFNAVNMIFLVSKLRRMIDTPMLEPGDIKSIVRLEAIRVDDAVRPYFTAYDRH